MTDLPKAAVDGYDAADWKRLRGDDLDSDERSPFARDFDRLLYTPEFRRLQGKAQVATAGEADFFRTRLTHTLEVAQVARRWAERVNRQAGKARQLAGTEEWLEPAREVSALPPEQQRIDPDLVEAAAIAHDLGHPPFAHVGEQALHDAIEAAARRWKLSDVGGFNANAQSFRLLTRIMSHHGSQRGRQLTIATLDASLKYPWVAGDPNAPNQQTWSVNPTERDELALIRAELPEDLRYEKTIEAEIMDWADDVAYSVHDLDDWNRAGYIPLARLATDEPEQARATEFIRSRLEGEGENLEERISAVLRSDSGPLEPFRKAHSDGEPIFDVTSGTARRAVRRMRAIVFDSAMASFEIQQRGDWDAPVPRRYQFKFGPGEDIRFTVTVLKELLWLYVVNDARMATQQHGHRRVITYLFEVYERALREGRLELFPMDRRRHLEEARDPREQLRTIADYICDMTDASALAQFERLRTGSVSLHDYA